MHFHPTNVKNHNVASLIKQAISHFDSCYVILITILNYLRPPPPLLNPVFLLSAMNRASFFTDCIIRCSHYVYVVGTQIMAKKTTNKKIVNSKIITSKMIVERTTKYKKNIQKPNQFSLIFNTNVTSVFF